MTRRLYSEGFFGEGFKRDRKAERARDHVSAIPARSLLMFLAIIALLIVIASAAGH